MIFGLIVLICVIIFMAFFIGKNIGNICTLWIFKTFENIPVSVLVLTTFAAGVLFALICVILIKLNSSMKSEPENKPIKREKIKTKKSLLKKADKINKELSKTDTQDDTKK